MSLRSKDPLGDRIKLYESAEAGGRLMPLLPAFARLDGKCFHKFCRGLARPYDQRLSDLMSDLTKDLVVETNACMGYTQSDEITLCWYSADFDSQILFDRRVHKMVGFLAAFASVRFNNMVKTRLPEKSETSPLFDCRVWNVPNQDEAANVFLWREYDATKNSISMAARAYYSHKELLNRNGGEMQNMLHLKGVNWNDYPSFFKRGTYVQKRIVKRKFTVCELQKLPAKHAARLNPDLEIERSVVMKLDMPVFSTVVNRAAVIFEGCDPQTAKEE